MKDDVGIIFISGSVLEELLCQGVFDLLPVHGIRSFEIMDVGYDRAKGLMVVLVQSDDIPSYVAYYKMLGGLTYCDGFPVIQIVLQDLNNVECGGSDADSF